MLGGVMDLQLLQQPPCLRRREGLVQRRRLVRVQVVHHQHDLLRLRVPFVHQQANGFREIDGRAPLRDAHVPLPGQRLAHHEQVRRPLPLVFVVGPRRPAWGGRHRHARLGDQLLAGLVQADLRSLGVAGPLVDLQHVLHLAHEVRALLGRDHPLLLAPRLEVVFLSVVRTHSGLMAPTTSSATSRSAKSFKVQRSRPSGGGLHAKATRRASCAPSSLRYCRPVGRWRCRAASRPSSTNAWRTRWTVDRPTSTASAILASGQPGPLSAWSALSRMRAWAWVVAAALPARNSACRRAYSAADNLTTYLTSMSFLREG